MGSYESMYVPFPFHLLFFSLPLLHVLHFPFPLPRLPLPTQPNYQLRTDPRKPPKANHWIVVDI